MVPSFFFFFSPPSSSHHGVLHLYQEVPTTLQLMVDKPSRPDLVWTRLLFIPSLPVPTPPPWPGFSWQALISLPNRLQTWGFAISHRAAHGIWASFQSECWGTWCNTGSRHFQVWRSQCATFLGLFVLFLYLLRWGEGAHAIVEKLRSCYIMPKYQQS